MCSSAPTAKSSAASTRSAASGILVAENKRISQDILIPPDMRGNARPGQVVVAEVVEQPSAHREALAKVIEVLGNYTDPGMEIEIALRKHDLPYRFSAAAQRQAGRLPQRSAERRTARVAPI